MPPGAEITTSWRAQPLLVTPPLIQGAEFPECGVPQLAGYLEERGVPFRQRDLNVEFFHDHLTGELPRREVLRAIERGALHRPPASWVRLVEERAPAAGLDGIEAVRHWTEACIEVFELHNPDLSMKGLAHAFEAGHRHYESFFRDQLLAPDEPPLVVGLSIVSASQLLPALLLGQMVKLEWPNTPVVIGGPWVVAAEPILDEFLERFEVLDGAILRRGERPFYLLCRVLAEGRVFDEVPNLVFRRDGRLNHTPLAEPPLLGSLPPPNFDGLDLGRYPVQMLPLQTNTRCYWGRCLFCYHDPLHGRLEQCPATQTARRVIDLKHQYGIASFFLADCATPLDWMKRFASALMEHDEPLRWSTMCRAEQGYSTELCQQLRQSGCTVVMVGLETVSEAGLQRVRKGVTPQMVEHTARFCAEAGIRVHLFVLDFPTNRREDFQATMDFVLKLSPWIEDFTVSRYQLSMLSQSYQSPETLAIDILGKPGEWLDVFDCPYDSSRLMPLSEFQQIAADYRRRFNATKERVGSPFVVASTAPLAHQR